MVPPPVETETRLSYYSVTRDGKSLHAYSNGDKETERLASLCVEMAPSNHRWYLQTVGRTTIGYLFDDGGGLVYFAIARDGLCSSAAVLNFLHRLRDDFRRSTTPVLRSLSLQQQRIHPIGRRSGAALEKVNSLPSYLEASSPCNRQFEGSISMEAPLLAISRKQEKRRAEKEDYQFQYHRATAEASCCSTSSSESEVMKSRSDSFEIESGNKNCESPPCLVARWKWWRLVGFVLAVEAALVIVWLRVCGGSPCIP